MFIGLGFPLTRPGGVPRAPVNLLTNSLLAGAASGTPGTAPTSWTANGTGGTATVTADAPGGGNKVRINGTAIQRSFTQGGLAVAANSVYCFSILLDVTSGTATLAQSVTWGGLPAGAATAYRLNGTTVASGTIPTAGDGQAVEVIITTAGTAGTMTARWGIGSFAAQTGDIAFYAPQFEPYGDRGVYLPT